MDEILISAFVAYRTKHGHETADALVRKHGGKALGNVPRENWPALAKDLGVKPATEFKHVSGGRTVDGEAIPGSWDELAETAFARFNNPPRRGRRLGVEF